jgi:hypothetical protein
VGLDSLEHSALPQRLEKQRSLGEYLLESARMVGDEDDYAVWKQSRLGWSATVAAILAGLRSIRGPQHPAPDHSPDAHLNWKQSYEAELRSVRSDLLLIAKAGEAVRSQPADEMHETPEQRIAVPLAARTQVRAGNRTPSLAF